MTRVLLVHQPSDGGVGRHVADLSRGLARRGYEVITCGPEPPAGADADCRHVTLDLGRAVKPGADLKMLGRFGAIVRATRPDLIHAHSSKAGAIARAGKVLQPRTPVLYTPHGYAFAGFFNHELERRAYREAERALAPLARRVLCVCEAEARLARSVGPSGRVRVVYNGIDAAAAGPSDPLMEELARRGPVIGTVTLLRPGKGLETLIDAMPSVLAAHGHVQLAVWGFGIELDALQARSRARNVEGSVHFLGPTADPLGALRGASVFVLPSWAESFPYVILEAMSVGLPIVATDVGGVGEAIRPGTDGLLVAKNDPEALAEALVAVLADERLAAELGGAARRRVTAQFSLAQMIDGVAGIYQEALGATGVARA